MWEYDITSTERSASNCHAFWAGKNSRSLNVFTCHVLICLMTAVWKISKWFVPGFITLARPRTYFVIHSLYFILSYKVVDGLSLKTWEEYTKWLKISAKYSCSNTRSPRNNIRWFGNIRIVLWSIPPAMLLRNVWENTILDELSVRNSLQIRNYVSELEITKYCKICNSILLPFKNQRNYMNGKANLTPHKTRG